MKSFKQYLKEETMPYAATASGSININDPAVLDGLNALIAGVTNKKFVTPYIAFERVQKALANFLIFPPRPSFLQGNSGSYIQPISQFGDKLGVKDDGNFVKDGEVLKDKTHGPHTPGEETGVISEPNTEVEKEYTLFFEYRQSDCGMYNIFAEIVNQEDLDDILADLEAELNDESEEEKDELDEMVDLSKVIMNKNTGNISSKDKKVDLSKVIMNKNTGKLSSMKEEKFTNRVPSANPYGNLNAASKEMNKPKPIPTRKTDDLDKMNRDADGNTVVEEEQIDELSAELVGKVNAARMMGKSSKTSAAEKTLTKAVKKKWLDSNVGKIKEQFVNLQEISDKLRSRYRTRARDDLRAAKRSAEFSEYEAKRSDTPPDRNKKFADEAEWLRSIAAKREKGIELSKKQKKQK